MVYLNVGVILYDFRPSPVLAKYYGVYISPYFPIIKNISGLLYWLRWTMGLLLSLYLEIQELLFTSGMVQGDIKYSYNCFRWYGIRLNIPWYPDCLTTINYVYKNSGETQELAADFTTYVDCLRVNATFVWDECTVEHSSHTKVAFTLKQST